LVRPEFAYVAENLLLRGGYRKTHFQADQTTLQAVSQMGSVFADLVEPIRGTAVPYAPEITFGKTVAEPPETYRFSELILQALVKKHLRGQENLNALLTTIGLGWLGGRPLEVLGELALPEGQVDVIIKDAAPMGVSNKVALEVKLGIVTIADVDQVSHYVRTLGSECRAGVLVARQASHKTIAYAKGKGVHIFLYKLGKEPSGPAVGFGDLMSAFKLESAETSN
jgi:hypothetical protein